MILLQEDFRAIGRIFGFAGKSLSKDEFGRAAKICLDGQTLSPHLVTHHSHYHHHHTRASLASETSSVKDRPLVELV